MVPLLKVERNGVKKTTEEEEYRNLGRNEILNERTTKEDGCYYLEE